MNRNDVTEKIISTKVSKGITWESVAKKVGQSKEWTTAACLGQMTLDDKQAKIIGKIFGLNAEEQKWLQVVPYKGSLPTPVPTDPLIYRWYEIVSVYGTTIKELIHEEFGDGIMSAIDFSMDIVRQPDPKGDRVNVVLSGKFLPYKTYGGSRWTTNHHSHRSAEKLLCKKCAWPKMLGTRAILIAWFRFTPKTRAGATARSFLWGASRYGAFCSANGPKSSITA
jgi:cyanate lyase